LNRKLWKIKSKYNGGIYLEGAQEFKPNNKIHPAIESGKYTSVLDLEGKKTGVFYLEISYYAEDINENEDNNEFIRDLGYDLLLININLLSFYSGNPIERIGEVDIHHEVDKVNHIKLLECKVVNVKPIIDIKIESLVLDEMSKKLNRAISFYVYGLKEKDSINSFLLYMSALEMLTGILKFENLIGSSYRECKKCKYKDPIKPGSGKKIQSTLMKYSNCSEDKAKQIWNERNDISHGSFELNSKSIREIIISRNTVKKALTKCIKELMNLSPDELPDEKVNFHISDAFMTLAYKKPEN